MELTAAIRLARGGRALLFLGAGFSCDTPNAGSGKMPSGQGFSNLLASKVDLPEGTSLMDTSEAYLEQYGATALVGELMMEFSAADLLPHEKSMATVPWKQIYTTNYDDVVEKAYKNRGFTLKSITSSMPVFSLSHGEAVCIHLNGSILGLNTNNLASQIRLTDSSYLTSALTDSEWAVRLRQDIDAAQAVFFVGYSTYDIDIARLLNSKPAIRDKSFFVVGSSPNSVLKRRIEKFGSNTGMTADQFFVEITKDEYAPTSRTSVPEICIRTYHPSPAKGASLIEISSIYS